MRYNKFALDFKKDNKSLLIWCVARDMSEAKIILENWYKDNLKDYQDCAFDNKIYMIPKKLDFAFKKSEFVNYFNYLEYLYKKELKAGYMRKE